METEPWEGYLTSHWCCTQAFVSVRCPPQVGCSRSKIAIFQCTGPREVIYGLKEREKLTDYKSKIQKFLKIFFDMFFMVFCQKVGFFQKKMVFWLRTHASSRLILRYIVKQALLHNILKIQLVQSGATKVIMKTLKDFFHFHDQSS